MAKIIIKKEKWKKKTVVAVRRDGKLITWTSRKVSLVKAREQYKKDNTLLKNVKAHHVNRQGIATVHDTQAKLFKQTKGKKHYVIKTTIEHPKNEFGEIKREKFTIYSKTGLSIKNMKEDAEKTMYEFIAGIHGVPGSKTKKGRKKGEELAKTKLLKREDIIRTYKHDR